MIVPDVNLLLYATFTTFPEHDDAAAWLEGIMNGSEPVGIAAPALFGFIRLATNPRVFNPPMDVEVAIGHVERWLERPHVHFLQPGSRHLELTFAMLKRMGVAGNLTTDAQLAALAIEHQAELCSNDTDFGRFPALRWVNPLAAKPPKPRARRAR